MDIQIGPLQIRLLCESQELMDFLAAHLAEHRVPQARSPALLRLVHQPGWPDRPPLVVFEDSVQAVFDGRASSPARICGDFDNCSPESLGPLRMRGLVRIFRFALELWLPPLNGLSLHAASVIHAGRGLLALGDSGAGKSTLTRLAGRAFSDEWSVVYEEDQRWLMCSAPFSPPFTGERLSGQHSLDACLDLFHAPPQQLARMSRSKTLARLLRQVSDVNRSPEQVEEVLRCAERLAGQIPSYLFRFFPEPASLSMLAESLGTSS